MKTVEMPIQIDMDGISIHISRKPIKHMYMRVHATTGDVRVTAPLRMPLNTIQTHLSSKRDWIHTVRTRAMRRTKPSPLRMENGEPIPFLGTSYPLMMHANASINQIIINESVLHCWTKTAAREDALKKLGGWYKQQMLALLPALIQKWEPIIGVSVLAFGVRPMKTRWGSCNVVAHRIWLNLSLIKMPLECLEYVLVHEMVHLLEANHSPRFYALMSRFMPTWTVHQKQLTSMNTRDAG
jgi:predicted metal-dependent hydrolase